MKKFENFDEKNENLVEIIELSIESRLYKKEKLLKSIKNKELLSWKSDLQKEIIREETSVILNPVTNPQEKEQIVELLYQIQDKKGHKFTEKLVKEILPFIPNFKSKRLISQLNKILYKPLTLSDLDKLKNEDGSVKELEEWDQVLYDADDNQGNTKDLTIEELLAIMQEGDKLEPDGQNYSRKDLILSEDFPNLVKECQDTSKKVTVIGTEAVEINTKPINMFVKEDLLIWADLFRETFKDEDKNQTLAKFNIYNMQEFQKDLLVETILVISQGVYLFKSYYPRATNLLSILLFLSNRSEKRGSLGNIETGEGKSTIVIILALLHSLCKLKTDVLTSSKVLAIRDSQYRDANTGEGWRDLYDWFGVECSNNCDEECEDPYRGDVVKKDRYDTCQVIYGEAGYFQRDILLTEFFGKGIRSGKTTADVVIMDEVDNMMIDNAVKTLYISHRIKDFKYLKDIFIRIWSFVNGKDGAYTDENIEKVEQELRSLTFIKDQIVVDFSEFERKLDEISADFPELYEGKEEQIRSFLLGETSILLLNEEIILHNQKLIEREKITQSIQLIMLQKSEILLEKLGLINQENENSILVPTTLQDFVDKNLKSWVQNAYFAKFSEVNDSYILGDRESAGPGEAIIMDKDTGVEQNSTKWSKGLHQFIQLKHNLKLSDESLKAVYLSNLNYFKKYNILYGMSGTVGDKDERSLIRDSYDTDFFQIPRFKKYRFLYEADVESVAVSQQEWLQNIVENVDENIDQQIEYTEEYIQDLKTSLAGFQQEKVEVEDKLSGQYEIQKLFMDKMKNLENQIQNILMTEKLSFEIISVANQELDFPQKVQKIQEIVDQLFRILDNSPEDLQEEAEKFKELLLIFDSIPSEYALSQKIDQFQLELANIDLTTVKTNKQKQLETTQNDLKQLNIQIQYQKDSLDSINANILTYEQEIERAEKGEKDPHMRPILIICENILSLQQIQNKITLEFPHLNIYTYDRAYRKFDKMKLDEGDIVIATNIAGRGTSFKVTEKAEKNGGLHVILTYIPGNIRVELQNFGRTARGGKKGTGTFIVLAQEDASIPQLKKERDEKEQQRLQDVKEKQFVRIEKEDKLFAQFNEFKKKITTIIMQTLNLKGQIDPESFDGQYVALQIDGLKNKFAVWLDSMEKQLKNIYQNPEENEGEIDKQFEIFQNSVLFSLNINKYMLIHEPGELNRLGRLYYDKQHYGDSLECFAEIMQKFGKFSEIAEYYSAIAVFSKHGQNLNSKKMAKKYLKNSLKVLKTARNSLLSRNQIIDSVNQFRSSYATQQLFQNSNENEAQLFQEYIKSINSQIGDEILGQNEEISIDAVGGREILTEIMKNEHDLVKNLRVSKKCVIGARILENDEEIIKNRLQNCNENQEICAFLLNNIGIITQSSYLTFQNYLENNQTNQFNSYDSYSAIVNILQNLQIADNLDIFRNIDTENIGKIVKTSKQIMLNQQFSSEKSNQILQILDKILQNSKSQNYFYQERQIPSEIFTEFLYTEHNFLQNTSDFVEQKHQIKLNPLLNLILMGTLDHKVFQNKGQQVKEVLLEYITEMEKLKLGIQAKLMDLKYQISDLERNRDDYLQKIEILRNQQAQYEQLYENLYIVEYSEMMGKLKEKTELNEEQISEILNHLDKYECISVDFKILKSKITNSTSDYIFQGAKTEILAFLQGETEIKLPDYSETIRLQDNWPYSKELLQDSIIEIIILKKLEDPETERPVIEEELKQTGKKLEIEQLFRLLGFDFGLKQSVLSIFEQFQLKNHMENLPKINEYLKRIDLTQVSTEKLKEFTQNLDISSYNQEFAAKREDIIENLVKFQGKVLNFEEFIKENTDQKILTSNEFSILRDILIDQKYIKSSIITYLRGESSDNISETNTNQEVLMKALFNNQGVLDSKNLLLKENIQSNKEIFSILQQKDILKPAKINYSIGPQTFSPPDYQFNNGNSWKKRQDFIDKQIEKIVNTLYSNKTKEEKQKTEKKLVNFIKQMAGELKTESKFDTSLETIDKKWPVGEVPKEFLEFYIIGFEKILKNFEQNQQKQQHWTSFKSTLSGALQIASAVSVEFLSDEFLNLLPQSKALQIPSNISQQAFSKLQKMSVDFYSQTEKMNSISSVLSKGIQPKNEQKPVKKENDCGEMVQGEAVSRNISKSVFTGVLSDVTDGYNRYSVQNLSQNLNDELINNLFPTELDSFTKENEQYREYNVQIEVLLQDIVKLDEEKGEILINQQLQETFNEVNSSSSTFMDSLDDLLGFIIDSVSANLYQKSAQLCRETQKFGVNSGGFLYELQEASFTEAQVSDIARTCSLLSKIQEKFIEKLQKLKEYLLNPEQEEEEEDQKEFQKRKERQSKSEEIQQELIDNFTSIFTIQLFQPQQQQPIQKSVEFIENQIEKMLYKPQNTLQQHVQNQTDFISSSQDQDNQNTHESDLIEKKMQILEEIGTLYKIEDLKKELEDNIFDKLVKEKDMVNNFKGLSLEDILLQHGTEGVRVYAKDGKFNVILENYVDFCRNLSDLKIEKVNEFLLQLVSFVENRRIKLYNVDKNEENQDQYQLSFLKSFGKATSNLEEVITNIGIISQQQQGYYVPLVQDHLDSKKLKVFTLENQKKEEVQSLLQSVLFISEYQRLISQNPSLSLSEIEEMAEKFIQNEELIPEFSNRLSIIGEISEYLKELYYQGSIVLDQSEQQNQIQERQNLSEILSLIGNSFNEKPLIKSQIIHLSLTQEQQENINKDIETYFLTQFKDQLKAEQFKQELNSAILAKNVQIINNYLRDFLEIAQIFAQNSVPTIEKVDWQTPIIESEFINFLERITAVIYLQVNEGNLYEMKEDLYKYVLVSQEVYKAMLFDSSLDIYSAYQQSFLQVIFKLLNNKEEIIKVFK